MAYPSVIISFLCLFLLPNNFEPSRVRFRYLSEAGVSDAKPNFAKGLLLLHNFEYPDAEEEFIAAQLKDPDFVLAYWGEAMVHDHPIWRDLDVEKSRAALKKLGLTPADRMAKAKTDFEKDLLQSVEILFGEGSKPDREKAYSDRMSQLYSKYPDNLDIASLYALSLLALKKSLNEWEDYNVQAATIAEKVLKVDPNHPGALHYLVHADDHPRYAQNGLSAANRYAQAASYAGHALHMPSHIYLALGMWDDVVSSNEVSWKASLARKERKHLTNNELAYHTHMWLMYGYLQQGKFKKAKEVLDEQVKLTNELPSVEARIHLMLMMGHYSLHTDDWSVSVPVKTEEFEVSLTYLNKLLEGYKLFREHRADDLAKVIDDLNKMVAQGAQLQQDSKDVVVCGVNRFTNSIPSEQQILNGRRRLSLLKGLHAWLGNDMANAEKYFKEGMPKEGSVVVGPPPSIVLAYELYGEFLLANKRPTEALQMFDKTLAMSPNRYVALKGKLITSRALKDSKTEKEVLSLLKQNLKESDNMAHKGLW